MKRMSIALVYLFLLSQANAGPRYNDTPAPGKASSAVVFTQQSAGAEVYGPVAPAAQGKAGSGEQDISNEHARPSPKWVRDAVIYEVYPRSFSKSESLLSIVKKLPEIKKLGVTVIWMMPIHPIGKLHRKGPLGSPYSIEDYYKINPEYGTLADFKKLVKAVHAEGLHIIMDLVADHTAWDNPLIKEHPDWYVHDSTGKIIPPNPDWTDVAQLNYKNKNLRKYMIDMMKYWVKDIGVDGFRCDAAWMVPLSFWNEARASLDSIKPVMMLAEASEPVLQLNAFDLTYAWNIYNVLGNIYKGSSPATAIDSAIEREWKTFPIGALRMRFNSNHDENVSVGPAIERYGPGGDSLTTALIATLPGVPLIYNGEEVGNAKRLSLFKQVTIDWNVKNGFRKLYQNIYSVRRTNPELVSGSYKPLSVTEDKEVLAYERRLNDKVAVCIFNFSKAPSGKFRVLVDGIGNANLRDALSGRTYKVREGHMELSMKGNGFLILLPGK